MAPKQQKVGARSTRKTGKQPEAETNSKENKAIKKLMSVQNTATIDEIVDMLKATPSMILPCYKLVSKRLLVPEDEPAPKDARSMLPENNTKINKVSNSSLKDIVDGWLGQNKVRAEGCVEGDHDLYKHLFLLATGEKPDAPVFDRDKTTFANGYSHRMHHHMKKRIGRLTFTDGDCVDWAACGVFFIDTETKRVVHRCSNKWATLPKAIRSCPDGWTIEENWSEYTSNFFNEETGMQIPCIKYFAKDRPWVFDGNMHDSAASWLLEQATPSAGSGRRVLA